MKIHRLLGVVWGTKSNVGFSGGPTIAPVGEDDAVGHRVVAIEELENVVFGG